MTYQLMMQSGNTLFSFLCTDLSLFLYIYIYTPKYVEIYSHLCIYQLDKVFNKETW